MKLLNSGNTKTIKGEEFGYRTFGIHLAPSNLSGYNTCLWASEGCKMACLNTSGRGIMKNVQDARINKTKLLFEDREVFMAQLYKEIAAAVKSAEKSGVKPCFRLNLTSDIPWEAKQYFFKGKSIFDHFPNCTYYDYTKSSIRMHKFLDGKMPKNYFLTFSRSEVTSSDRMARILDKGGNVAVVFRGDLPKSYLGYPVINGDVNDLRFLDPKGAIVGLVEKYSYQFDKATGKNKLVTDKSGFVVENF
jgi:hypothetical protein